MPACRSLGGPKARHGNKEHMIFIGNKRATSRLAVAMVRFLCVVLLGFSAELVEAKSELSCLVVPQVTLTIGTPVVGVLNSVAVNQGDVVKEGDILATLESSLEQAEVALAKAKAEMDAAEKSTQMKAEMCIRDSAQAELTNRRLADLELQRTSAEVGLRTIRSPINGVVVERYMSPGEFPKQERIMRLAQINPLRVEAYVPVSLLGKITVGMEMQVKPEAPVSGTYKAVVTVVDRVVDAASGTFGVRLELPNPDLKLAAGLKCAMVVPGSK